MESDWVSAVFIVLNWLYSVKILIPLPGPQPGRRVRWHCGLARREPPPPSTPSTRGVARTARLSEYHDPRNRASRRTGPPSFTCSSSGTIATGPGTLLRQVCLAGRSRRRNGPNASQRPCVTVLSVFLNGTVVSGKCNRSEFFFLQNKGTIVG